MTIINPYADNILIDGLRPLLSREEALSALTNLPRRPPPAAIADIPRHVRLHYLAMLREFHVASREEARLLDSVDLIARNSLHLRNPAQSSTWRSLYGHRCGNPPPPAAMGVLVSGPSGTGKTSATQNVLSTLQQIIDHETFPFSAKPLRQLVHLSVEVPASGKAVDLAVALMLEFDRVCQTSRFENSLRHTKGKGIAMLNEWKQAASAQFLAVLHLDEIHNLFKIRTLARRKSKSNSDDPPQLSIVEDDLLKWILSLLNNQIAIVISGTPDGASALTSRFATSQRLTGGGYLHFKPIAKISDPLYAQILQELLAYQYVSKALEYSDELAQLILDLTGGVLRIVIALWVSAHRVAFERKEDDLRVSDFQRAADTYLAPLKPAIEAIRSGDEKQMRKFSDLLQVDEEFWASIWSPSMG